MGTPADAPLVAEESEPLPPIPKRSWVLRVREYFLGEDPTLLTALVPTCFLSMLLYTRHPATNFIFDEQEALLANPYVRASVDKGANIPWLAAFRRDFWGLLPDRTIGSYRPLPDIVWRALWKLGARDQGAFPHAYLNVMLHGVNGALLVLLVFRWTRDRLTAWLTGLLFVATAVVTEAVTGVVGLADVLGGMGALLALLALNFRGSLMPAALCLATLVGLYSKESALCIVPLVPLAALLTADLVHPGRPLRLWRAFLATVATVAAFVFYVEMRRHLFPVATPTDLTAAANAGKPRLHRFFAAALRWYAQPMLPHDPLNNPFIDASPPYRVAGALRVYARGLGQVLFPWTLSGDYSAPQEPIPDRLVFPESVIGGLAVIIPVLACTVLVIVARVRARRREADPAWDSLRSLLSRVAGWDLVPIVAFATMWIVVSYFPVSNIPVVLPTVRAERFWYFPAIGSAMLLGMGSAALLRRARARGTGAFAAAAGALVLLFGFQCFAARRHAFDYTNDLVFWNATRKA
ncbi:MAG TPA: tetratricopeptide repeat protein, partial [Polyangiaceae bacterium]|nr:tetratricopeptide repeat protein [Polyangiaceae bacterium]